MRSYTKKNLIYEHPADTAAERSLWNLTDENAKGKVKSLQEFLEEHVAPISAKLIYLVDTSSMNKILETYHAKEPFKNEVAALLTKVKKTAVAKDIATKFKGDKNFSGVDADWIKTDHLDKRKPTLSSLIDALGDKNTQNKFSFQFTTTDAKNLGYLFSIHRLIVAMKLQSQYDNGQHYKIGSDNGNPDYSDVKPHLLKASGLYCGYCESVLTDGNVTDVEHKLPKSLFKTEERAWDNHVPACKVCNSSYKKALFVFKASSKPAIWNVHNGNIAQSGKNNATKTQVDTIVTSNNDGKIDFEVNYVDQPKYEGYLNFARNNTIWPDKRHPKVGSTKDMLSFEAMEYNVVNASTKSKEDVSLTDLSENSVLVTKKQGNQLSCEIEIGGSLKQFLIHTGPSKKTPKSKGKIGADTSVKLMVDICKLNQDSDNEHKDQRVIRRTKAWYHALSQLKILKDFDNEFKKINTYYQTELNPLMITGNSVIEELRVPDFNNLESVEGKINFAKPLLSLKNGLVKAHKCPGTSDNLKIGTGNKIKKSFQDADINGIVEEGKFTGVVHIKKGKTPIPNQLLLILLEAPVSNKGKTLAMALGGPSRAVKNVSPSFLEWEMKRNDLNRLLISAEGQMQKYLWQNIVNMVLDGGFYSTWIRTFQEKCDRGTKEIDFPYDVDLIRRLDVQSYKYPDNAFQYHGTDAEEIIDCLT